jgi:hypothetical protein
MKKITLLLMMTLAFVNMAKADVEWTIWEGKATKTNVQGNKLDWATLEAGDIIYVYGSGTLSQAIYRISGDNWETWTALQSYSPAVVDGDNYYHVITSAFLENFNYSNDDTKGWAVGNWDEGKITKVTIKKGKSMIKTALSSVKKTTDTFEYTIDKQDFSKMVAGDYLHIPASKRSEADGKSYKVEFKEAENDWTTYTTLWGPNHDAIWKIEGSTIDADIKEHPLYIYGELYDTNGVNLYHPVSSFSIGSLGYATFSADQQVTVPNTVKAYKGTISGDKLVLTQFTDNVIPANQGAIIKGDEGAVLEFVASSTETSETSDIQPCTEAEGKTIPSDDGYDYYVLYPGAAESETNLPLSTLVGAWGAWHPTEVSWNSSPYKITYTGNASGEGGWVDKDWSDYDYLQLNFSSNTLDADATFYVAYYEHDDNTTEATLSEGSTTVRIPLDDDYKNCSGNFSMWSNATSGSLTFESAALIDNDGATVAEFRKTTSGTLAANKAYLKIPTGGGARALSIVFDDEQETTAIESVAPKAVAKDNVYYDLQGRRVAQPTKGLYIVNGKKVFIK